MTGSKLLSGFPPSPAPSGKLYWKTAVRALKSFHSSFQAPFLLPSHTQASLGRGWESLAETCRMLNNNRRVSFKEGKMCLDCTYPKLYFPCFDIQPIHASLLNCFLSIWDLSGCDMEQAQAEMGLVSLLLWRDMLPQASTETAGVCHVQTAVSEHMKCGQ